MDMLRKLGFDAATGRNAEPPADVHDRINLNLAVLGEPVVGRIADSPALAVSQNLINSFRARSERMGYSLRPPVDQRIEAFLARYLADEGEPAPPRLPGKVFNLLQHGMARTMSLPARGDHFQSDIIGSWRLANGILHNPRNDRRTTSGVFHVAEGGLPIPADKKAVPRVTFGRILSAALDPPPELLLLPYTAEEPEPARLWVSLLLRPTVLPPVPGQHPAQSMEIRFFAPAGMVCNLDFVESIFGNGGDPYLAENDAGLDLEHWSGHTGCVILAPHLTGLRKRDVGLPPESEATERQRRDGMCWRDPDERYNDGSPFKLTARSAEGVIVTVIADNYFGYCKKEVKTQISFAANLLGAAEEEHAGGTLAFASYDLGDEFELAQVFPASVAEGDQASAPALATAEPQAGGYALDRNFTDIVYLPWAARFSLSRKAITWPRPGGEEARLPLRADRSYIYPNGYRVELRKPAAAQHWRLVGTVAEPVHCHKPCTVSGGGKSEISKPISDAIIFGVFYVHDLEADLDAVQAVLEQPYGQRYRDAARNGLDGRAILSPDRSLGSVIKLLTPSRRYSDEHNAYLASIPPHIKELVILVKRLRETGLGEDWREQFSVDIINGVPGHALKYRGRTLVNSYLRLGYDESGAWRVFSLREDFYPASKVQTEDDITVSTVVPCVVLPEVADATQAPAPSCKLVHNCEFRLFQRPDEAIHRGYDRKTEEDFAAGHNFLSNYQPINRGEAEAMVADAVAMDEFTAPLRGLLQGFAAGGSGPGFVGSTANPRLVDGVASRNPRYLQLVGTLENPRNSYLAELTAGLAGGGGERRRVFPVTSLLPGRRNNGPEPGVRPLAAFNPIHYLPLPEAFLEFVSSMTGRSPSTTGAGSEGALTKGPFNALLPITDLNNALVAAALTGLDVFLTSAGCIGPRFRVDHDISLLIPELWCRMKPEERSARWLIEQGLLEPVPALHYGGRTLPTGLLGYRMNRPFVNHFFGRVFTSPELLFEDWMLRPEEQGLDVFADSLDNMLETHRQVAQHYFADGSIDDACPPLRALLHIMRDGVFEGLTLDDPGLRSLFDPQAILKSDWYQARLDAKQQRDIEHWRGRLAYLDAEQGGATRHEALRTRAVRELERVTATGYRESLVGTLGLDPSLRSPAASGAGC